MASASAGEGGEEEGEEEEKSGEPGIGEPRGVIVPGVHTGKEYTAGFAVSRNTHSTVSLLISVRGTLSLSILGPRYPQAGPPGRLTPGKVIFPRVARCFYVAEKIKLGNPGGKEGELCKTLLST